MPRSKTMIVSAIILLLIFTLFLAKQPAVNAAFSIQLEQNTEESCCSVVVNGGFESDSTWRMPITTWSGGYDSSTAHSGQRSARLGILSTTEKDPNRHSYSTAYQTVTIPADAESVILSFWYKTGTQAASGDWQRMVLLQPRTYRVVKVLMQTLENEIEWQQAIFDLSAYSGEQLVLYFEVYNNGDAKHTWMFVDDVQIDKLNDLTAEPTSAGPTPTPEESVLQPEPTLPPDPSVIRPDLDQSVATNLYTADAFLFSGENVIQSDIAPETIDPLRIAVIRGQVTDLKGTALSGVQVSILNHPELGKTQTREDGMFDLAVNGGGNLIVTYQKEDYLTLHRQLDVPWQDYVWAPDVALIPLDQNVTEVDLTQSDESFTVAQGSVISDTDGLRQATLLFPRGITATLTMTDGSQRPVDTLHVRLTEYTVGDKGPAAMPAELPPTSGYTYAAEVSADEALAVGARSVEFSQSLYFYLEDFIGFPVGSAVPAGYYDRTKRQWIASENGRVIELLSITDNLANIDANGDQQADSPEELAAIGIDSAELEKLAQLYPQLPVVLWR
ncbi:hypothetical protein KC957_00315, partial [Candidatus Saccharibacteria bacterium]|nr:hypothetical protein [Candidatus Saccharibacteria bacterium]